MQFPDIQALIATDLSATDALIRTSLASEVSLLQEIGEYVFAAGGKRARVMLTLLAAKACDLKGPHAHLLGAIIEMIHTATLLHDDVIDASEMRRGKPSANIIFGNTASVLSGDFLYSRAFELMVRLNSVPVLGELASTSNKIAEGEMLQLQNCHRIDVTEAEYLLVIESKTATLFEAAAKIPALMAGSPPDVFAALARFGNDVGVAFQILDDLMDYTAEASEMGKNPGDDLAEGKMTLPLIYAKETANSAETALIDQAILTADASQLPKIISILERTKALQKVRNCARRLIDRAEAQLAFLPQNEYVKALGDFARLAIERSV